jgi:hypothetical protein
MLRGRRRLGRMLLMLGVLGGGGCRQGDKRDRAQRTDEYVPHDVLQCRERERAPPAELRWRMLAPSRSGDGARLA